MQPICHKTHSQFPPFLLYLFLNKMPQQIRSNIQFYMEKALECKQNLMRRLTLILADWDNPYYSKHCPTSKSKA